MSSVTDAQFNDKTGAPEKGEPQSKRPNPVVLEVPVSVAGARPASAHDKRELFTEETTTVLVFKDGAVIQLSAAIAVGQLLFLTDKRTKKEVVCQVVHKRSHRPTTCYVELEFTEDVKNFWGVSFPKHAEREELPRKAEAVEAEETTEDTHSEPPAAPTTEDVAQLRKEVAALRAQLRELQGEQAREEKSEDEDAEARARRLAAAELAARAAVESEAKERAEEMDRKARANAARLAEEARQKFAQTQVQGQTQDGAKNQKSAAGEEDDGKRRLAEAEAEAAARAAGETEVRKQSWGQDEESRAAAEEAKKWEQEAIENEKKRRKEEQERVARGEVERAQAESQKTRVEPEAVKEEVAPVPQPPMQAPVSGPKIGMKLPSAAALKPTQTETPKPEAASAAVSADKKEEIDPLEELLPKPALDFSKARKEADPNDPFNIYKPMRKKAGGVEIAVAAVLVVVLVGGGGFAWYKNKLPFFHRGLRVAAKSAPAAKPVASTALNATPSAPAGNGTAAATVGASGQLADNGAGSVTASGANGAPPVTTPESAAVRPAVPKNAGSATPPEEKAPENKAAENKVSVKKNSPVKAASSKSGGKNHGKAETSSESRPKPEQVVVAEDAPVIPAKLLHAVQPVYPPTAMLNYITGDVRVEAVVDATGHIGAIQILVGPAALRQAAIDALKQYEYAPATQGGKAVVSKVTVTIKFWFDP